MKNGMNIVLFRGPEISTTESTSLNKPWLFYKGNNTHQITEIKVKSKVAEAQPGAGEGLGKAVPF